jgi:uncharacterized protein (DUF488 family)
MKNTFTIGFTRKSAQKFFTLLKANKVERLIDVRLNNISQLSGFAKRDDLKYLLSELCGADYLHLKELTPTQDILDAYKKKIITWDAYADKFNNLMEKRNIERVIDKSLLENGCLLCSEDKPHQCHRRLVSEYLNEKWGNAFRVIHLT